MTSQVPCFLVDLSLPFLCTVSSDPFVSGITLIPPYFGGCCLCQLLLVVPWNRAWVYPIFYLLHPLFYPLTFLLIFNSAALWIILYCTGTVVATETIFFVCFFSSLVWVLWIFVACLFLVTACSPLPTNILNLPVAWFFIFNVQYRHLNRHVPLCELEICLMEAATAVDIREIISLKQQVVGGIQVFPRGWFCILSCTKIHSS